MNFLYVIPSTVNRVISSQHLNNESCNRYEENGHTHVL